MALPLPTSLSPSKVSTFKDCALAFRFSAIDKLPEPPSMPAIKGTTVHRALELLFAAEPQGRTPEAAQECLATALEEMQADEEYRSLDLDEAQEDAFAADAAKMVERYFDLEDPRRLEPADRELYVEALLDSKLLLRGFVDRIDVTPDGRIRLVDYKTGASPGVGYEAKALFQMRFYALVVWKLRGIVPSMLQLIYLGNGEVLRYEPDEDDLRATARKVEAVWAAIRLAQETGDWQPNPSRLCDWCSFHAYCPTKGGTVPPLPEPTPVLVDASTDESED